MNRLLSLCFLQFLFLGSCNPSPTPSGPIDSKTKAENSEGAPSQASHEII